MRIHVLLFSVFISTATQANDLQLDLVFNNLGRIVSNFDNPLADPNLTRPISSLANESYVEGQVAPYRGGRVMRLVRRGAVPAALRPEPNLNSSTSQATP